MFVNNKEFIIWGFIILRFCSKYFTVFLARLKNIVHITDFIKKRFIKSRFHRHHHYTFTIKLEKIAYNYKINIVGTIFFVYYIE